jgi:hypothetical protein
VRKLCVLLLLLASCTKAGLEHDVVIQHNLAGTVVVPGCEIAPSHGQRVSVSDPEGKIVAVGKLHWSNIGKCNLDFLIRYLPVRSSYTFSFASIPGKATFSFDQLSARDWSVSIDPGTQPVILGPGHCSQPSPVHVQQPGLVDLSVVAKGGSAEAVVMEGLPFPTRAEIKIVWRMTGSGPLNLVATGDSGPVRPQQVREHPMASIEGHGSEWGSVFRFPTSGCYVVHAQRTGVSAYTKIGIR